MCGIAGFTGLEPARMGSVLDRIHHRGPDARSSYHHPESKTTLGHVRLSILDLDERSNQPFFSPCRRYVLVYNGEIYNYLDLKRGLEERGRAFRTTGDTEVLMAHLIEFGAAGVSRLEGMFAFALLDTVEQKLLLARDPIGEKPLYYTVSGGQDLVFAFGSEPKALLALAEVDRSLDRVGLAHYLRFLYTAPPHTFFQGIRELPPGHLIEKPAAASQVEPRPYYRLEPGNHNGLGHRDWVSGFRQRFQAAVTDRLMADVPVGLYLSGGLDSNMILNTARTTRPEARFQTYTMGYGGSALARNFDESGVAERAAELAGYPNKKLVQVVGEYELFGELERMIQVFDQPFGNPTAPVAYRLAELAVTHSKVCLVGDGGDEVGAGYPRYKALLVHRYLNKMPDVLLRSLQRLVSLFPERGRWSRVVRRVRQFFEGGVLSPDECCLAWMTYLEHEQVARALGCSTADLPRDFEESLRQIYRTHADDPIRAACTVDLHSFVPFNLLQCADRTGMAHSLELRSPFLAPGLVEFGLACPGRYRVALSQNKPLFVQAMGRDLPEFVLKQPMKAFNPPSHSLLCANLREVRDYLVGSNSVVKGLLERSFLTELVEDLETGRRDSSTIVWGLLSLEMWLRRDWSVPKL